MEHNQFTWEDAIDTGSRLQLYIIEIDGRYSYQIYVMTRKEALTWVKHNRPKFKNYTITGTKIIPEMVNPRPLAHKRNAIRRGVLENIAKLQIRRSNYKLKEVAQ